MTKQAYTPLADSDVTDASEHTEGMETTSDDRTDEELAAFEAATARPVAPRPVVQSVERSRTITPGQANTFAGHPNVILQRDEGVVPWAKGQSAVNPLDRQSMGATIEQLNGQKKFLIVLQRAKRDEPNYVCVWINGVAFKIMRGRRAEVPLAVYLQLVEAGEVEPDIDRPQDYVLYPFGGVVDESGRDVKTDITGRNLQSQLDDPQLIRDARPIAYDFGKRVYSPPV